MRMLTLQVPEALLVQSGSSEAALTREAQWQLALRFFELGASDVGAGGGDVRIEPGGFSGGGESSGCGGGGFGWG
jgi:uncharacterized membrane protein YgcG